MTENIENCWQTERLVFRSVRETDYDWFFNNIDNDPVNRALTRPTVLAPPRREKPEEWIKTWQGPSRLLDVVICLHKPPGSEAYQEERSTESSQPDKIRIGFLGLGYGGFGSSPHNRACELGITLTAAYQQHGYGTEAVRWALAWAFRRANMHSVNLGSVEFNKRAHKCYEKCGFKFQGRKRQCFWHERKWYDFFFFDILEDEWEASWDLPKEKNENVAKGPGQ